jgi:hypothetical protein
MMQEINCSDDVLDPFISVIDTGDAMIVASGGFGKSWCKDELGMDELKTVPDIIVPICDCDIAYIDEEITDDDATQPNIGEMFHNISTCLTP